MTLSEVLRIDGIAKQNRDRDLLIKYQKQQKFMKSPTTIAAKDVLKTICQFVAEEAEEAEDQSRKACHSRRSASL